MTLNHNDINIGTFTIWFDFDFARDYSKVKFQDISSTADISTDILIDKWWIMELVNLSSTDFNLINKDVVYLPYLILKDGTVYFEHEFATILWLGF